MTRYGKSEAIAIGIILAAMFSKRALRIVIVAPTTDLAKTIMKMVGQHITDHEFVMNLVDIQRAGEGIEKLRKEVSKSRITWKTGCEIRIVSIDISNEGRALLSLGADILVVDESESCPATIIEERAMRMLGDNPKESIAMMVTNPFYRGFSYAHWKDPKWIKIHVGWKQAVKEGRTDEQFIMERKEELKQIFGDSEGARRFEVLYESIWPESGYDDQLIPYVDADAAIREPPEGEPIKRTLGVDVATRGVDMCTFVINEEYALNINVLRDLIGLPKTDTNDIVDKIIELDAVWNFDEIRIDYTGNGEGVVDILMKMPEFRGRIFGIIMGSRPDGDNNRKRYANKKAHYYWQFRELFLSRRIITPKHDLLYNNCVSFGYEISKTTNKIRIIDPKDRKKAGYNVPDKMPSPDWSDAAVYSVVKIKKRSRYRSVKTRM